MMRAVDPFVHDPSFVDYEAYANAIYSPPPALVALAAADPFWRTLGGSEHDPWGDGGEALRQRLAAYGHHGAGGYLHDPWRIAGGELP